MNIIKEDLEKSNAGQSVDKEVRKVNIISTPLRTLIKDIARIDYSGETNIYRVVSGLHKAIEDYEIATPDESLESLLVSLNPIGGDVTTMLERITAFFVDVVTSEYYDTELDVAIETFYSSIITEYPSVPSETIDNIIGKSLCRAITATTTAYENDPLYERDVINPDEVVYGRTYGGNNK